MKTLLILSALVLTSASAFAAEETTTTTTTTTTPAAPIAPAQTATEKSNSGLLKDFDTLGGNDVLLDKARALNPEETVSIVQDRIVNRRNRFEVSPEFVSVLGGDAYNHTDGFAVNAYFHINPHWALGAKYEYDINHLRPEGQKLIDDTTSTGRGVIPDIDYPKGQALALLNWFPIYGKMNLYDLGVTHFDIYAVAGGGQIFLNSGKAPTYTAGGGIGLWWSQHLSTRLELRWQGYTAKRLDGDAQMNLTVADVQVGYLF